MTYPHAYALDMANRLQQAGRLAPGYSVEALADTVRDRSEGNHLYTHTLFLSLSQGTEAITAATVDEWPARLEPLYRKLLERVSSAGTPWLQQAPVVAALAVAKTSLTEKQLGHFVGLQPLGVRDVLSGLRPVLHTDESLPPDKRPWAIYHRSFVEFVLSGERAGTWVVDEQSAHQGIADYYLGVCTGDWTGCDEDECGNGAQVCSHYGLRHTAYHLSPRR